MWGDAVSEQLPTYPCEETDVCYDFDDANIDDFPKTTTTYASGDDWFDMDIHQYEHQSTSAWPTFIERRDTFDPQWPSEVRDVAAFDDDGVDRALVYERREEDGQGIHRRVEIWLPGRFESVELVMSAGGQNPVPARENGVRGSVEPKERDATHRLEKLVYPAGSDGRKLTKYEFDAEGSGFSHLVLKVRGTFAIHKLCLSREADAKFGGESAARIDAIESSVERYREEDAVFEPDTEYRVAVTVETKVAGLDGGPLEGQNDGDTWTAYGYFRTEGPPSLVELTTPVGVNPEKFASGLTDLTRYVEQTRPATIFVDGEDAATATEHLASNTERSVLPKPVYRGDPVGVAFDENYVRLLYRLANRDLSLALFDANNRPIRTPTGYPLVLDTIWGESGVSLLSRAARRWLKAVESAPCVPMAPPEVIREADTGLTDGHVLEPDAVHERDSFRFCSAKSSPRTSRVAGPKPTVRGTYTATRRSRAVRSSSRAPVKSPSRPARQ